MGRSRSHEDGVLMRDVLKNIKVKSCEFQGPACLIKSSVTVPRPCKEPPTRLCLLQVLPTRRVSPQHCVLGPLFQFGCGVIIALFLAGLSSLGRTIST